MVRVRFLSLFAAVVAAVIHSVAGTPVKVEADYQFVAPSNMSVEEAQRTAVQRACLQALADRFGTDMSQTTATVMSNTDGHSTIDFSSVGFSRVNGQWLETLGEPSVDMDFTEQGLSVRVHVCGMARERSESQPVFSSMPLRNGREPRFASLDFRDGDEFYLSFTSPVDGYVAVFLVDDSDSALKLLPYPSAGDVGYTVEGGHSSVLFSIVDAPPRLQPSVTEMWISCNKSPELNELYVVFSPTPMLTPQCDALETISLSAFRRWLADFLTSNPQASVAVHNLTITKP